MNTRISPITRVFCGRSTFIMKSSKTEMVTLPVGQAPTHPAPSGTSWGVISTVLLHKIRLPEHLSQVLEGKKR